MRRVRPRPWLSPPVSNVQNLFSAPEPSRRNPRCEEVELVGTRPMFG